MELQLRSYYILRKPDGSLRLRRTESVVVWCGPTNTQPDAIPHCRPDAGADRRPDVRADAAPDARADPADARPDAGTEPRAVAGADAGAVARADPCAEMTAYMRKGGPHKKSISWGTFARLRFSSRISCRISRFRISVFRISVFRLISIKLPKFTENPHSPSDFSRVAVEFHQD